MLIRRWKPLCAAAALLLILPAGLVRAGDAADLVKLVPQDAWGFAVLKSIDAVDARAKLLQEKLGVPIPGQPSQMMLASLPFADQLDTASPWAVVVLDFQQYGDQGAVLLVPAKDPKALLEKCEATEPEEGICQFTLMDQPLFAAVKDKTVILGPNSECVSRVAKATKTAADDLAPARSAALKKSDVFVSVSLRRVLAAYKDMVMGFAGMMAATSGTDSKQLEQVIEMFSQVEALDICVTLDDKGLDLAFLMTAKGGSDLEKLLADSKNSSDDLLAWLPNEKYVVAIGGTAAYSEHAEKFGSVGQSIDGLLKMAALPGTDEKAAKTISEEMTKLTKATGRFAASLACLPSGPGGMVGMTLVVETGSASEYVDGIRKIYGSFAKLSDDEDFQTFAKALVHKPDDESVAGGKVDTLRVDLSQFADMIGEDELEQIGNVLGKDLAVRFGAVQSKYVVITFGGGQDRFNAVCESIGSKGKSLSSDAGIAEISGHLPKPRVSEGYIAIDNALRGLKEILKVLGEDDPIPFDVPTVDAPVAIASSLDGKVSRTHFFVPMKLMLAAKKVIDAQMTAPDDFDEEEKPSGGAEVEP